MESYEDHLAIATSLAIGLLVGLEREQTRGDRGTRFVAGVRTYPIFGLVGALSTLLAANLPWLPLVALVGVIALIAVSYAASVKAGDYGMTTEASIIAVFLLGALTTSHGIIDPFSERLLLAIALGVLLTFLLSSKDLLHAVAAKVSRDDFYATVKFLIVVAIVLPLLPRRNLGPFDAINPFNVGLMVVTIAGLSFVGFVAMRLLGPGRGVVLSAALGGLVSSTAVTISFASRTKENPALAPTAAGAIAIASTIMLARVAVLVALINPALLEYLAIPLTAAALGAILVGLIAFRTRKQEPSATLEVKNPFELGSAIRFGLAFAVVLLATRAAQEYLGDQGLYLAALVAGGTDVDAITLSTAKLSISPTAAVTAIMIAVAANTLVKSSLTLAIAGRALGKRAFALGAAIIIFGAIGLVASVLI